MKKRLISLLLALGMLLTLVPAAAFADDTGGRGGISSTPIEMSTVMETAGDSAKYGYPKGSGKDGLTAVSGTGWHYVPAEDGNGTLYLESGYKFVNSSTLNYYVGCNSVVEQGAETDGWAFMYSHLTNYGTIRNAWVHPNGLTNESTGAIDHCTLGELAYDWDITNNGQITHCDIIGKNKRTSSSEYPYYSYASNSYHENDANTKTISGTGSIDSCFFGCILVNNGNTLKDCLLANGEQGTLPGMRTIRFADDETSSGVYAAMYDVGDNSASDMRGGRVSKIGFIGSPEIFLAGISADQYGVAPGIHSINNVVVGSGSISGVASCETATNPAGSITDYSGVQKGVRVVPNDTADLILSGHGVFSTQKPGSFKVTATDCTISDRTNSVQNEAYIVADDDNTQYITVSYNVEREIYGWTITFNGESQTLYIGESVSMGESSISVSQYGQHSAIAWVGTVPEDTVATLTPVFEPAPVKSYTLTVNSGMGCSNEAMTNPIGDTVPEGTLVFLKYTGDEGGFTHWEAVPEDSTQTVKFQDAYAERTTFNMPSCNVTIRLADPTAPVENEITVDVAEDYKEGVGVTDESGNNLTKAAENETVYVTFDETRLDLEHMFTGWEAYGADGAKLEIEFTEVKRDGKTYYTFTMPAEPVTLKPVIKSINENQDDIISGDELSGGKLVGIVAGAAVGMAAVGTVAYYAGTTAYLKSVLPEGSSLPTTRAQLAQLLWNDAGKPAPAAVLPADCTDTDKALTWCVEQQLLAENANPDSYVTRVQVIKAWNALQELKKAR